MNYFLKTMTALTLGLSSQFALAAPAALLTHNHTNVESNAYVDGLIKSPYPSPAKADNRVAWISVRIACTGHIVNNKCNALVKMATNTANPIDLGWVEMDMLSGEINPKEVDGNGYHLVVNGPAEVTLTEN